jgi:hypothetical protein
MKNNVILGVIFISSTPFFSSVAFGEESCSECETMIMEEIADASALPKKQRIEVEAELSEKLKDCLGKTKPSKPYSIAVKQCGAILKY